MKFSTSVWSISIAVLSYSPKTTLAASNKTVSTPAGCRVLPGDVEWPSAEVWKKELPNAIPRSRFQSPFSSTHPNYRVSATTVQEVQNAVRFATKHNLRLSIINSGHDYMGRNDAPNGLWLDVSNLLGVRVLESFQPTEQGQPDPDPSGKVNGITPIPGTQAAATFGPGLSAVELNQALKASKVFAISGAAPGVRIAGGWGQMAGHGPLTNQYGLGVDQWLEFKVVTADGSVQVANKVSNPDLFWAIRGGGGGAFGVVVQATVKVYPRVPIAAYSWHIASNTASVLNAAGIGSGADGLYDAMEHLARNIPSIADNGSSAHLYLYPTYIRGFSIGVGETNATAAWLQSMWDPVLTKMASFKGNKPVMRHILTFDNHQEFFDYTYMRGMASGCYETKTTKGSPSSATYVAGNCTSSKSKPANLNTIGKPERTVPAPPGKFGLFDSVFLSKEVLLHPDLKTKMKKQALGGGWLMLSGNKAHRPDEDVSVHPGWRTAYVHAMTASIPPFTGVGPYLELDPAAGSYGNEGSPTAKNWKQRFWGSNYDRLAAVKTRYDNGTLFWVSPGINADLLEVMQGGRLCERGGMNAPIRMAVDPAPDNGNVNRANPILSRELIFADLEIWADPAKQDIEGRVVYR